MRWNILEYFGISWNILEYFDWFRQTSLAPLRPPKYAVASARWCFWHLPNFKSFFFVFGLRPPCIVNMKKGHLLVLMVDSFFWLSFFFLLIQLSIVNPAPTTLPILLPQPKSILKRVLMPLKNARNPLFCGTNALVSTTALKSLDALSLIRGIFSIRWQSPTKLCNVELFLEQLWKQQSALNKVKLFQGLLSLLSYVKTEKELS